MTTETPMERLEAAWTPERRARLEIDSGLHRTKGRLIVTDGMQEDLRAALAEITRVADLQEQLTDAREFADGVSDQLRKANDEITRLTADCARKDDLLNQVIRDADSDDTPAETVVINAELVASIRAAASACGEGSGR